MNRPSVTAFFDNATNTISYIVADPATSRCAVVDSLLDYDGASGRTSTESADAIIAKVQELGLTVEWIIDTHVHADHVTGAHYIKENLGGKTGIGAMITEVQKVFGKIFNEGRTFHTDGSQFDHLFNDNETYTVGELTCNAIHTPGHTSACMVHSIGGSLFVGDTLFMPDFGTARCDFPGGDAGQLYRSIQRIFQLPDDTPMYMCHDYKAPGRDVFAWETTVGEQKRNNVQVNESINQEEFVKMRTARDNKLGTPKLMVPSVQINMRAGELPDPEDNGMRYIKVPLNEL
ncbi:MBL fold metallo-hydrolase [Chromatiales bacterium (ex Bugula neritina AB1)]|nr:MBL fold metallo-hydrolase [Chromatiales bacterium (ex Bugula neritina AB1)]